MKVAVLEQSTVVPMVELMVVMLAENWAQNSVDMMADLMVETKALATAELLAAKKAVD